MQAINNQLRFAYRVWIGGESSQTPSLQGRFLSCTMQEGDWMKLRKYVTQKYPAVGHRIIKRISKQDLNDPSFHWYDPNIGRAMKDMFRDILENHLSTRSILSLCLASIADHSEFLKEII